MGLNVSRPPQYLCQAAEMACDRFDTEPLMRQREGGAGLASDSGVNEGECFREARRRIVAVVYSSQEDGQDGGAIVK